MWNELIEPLSPLTLLTKLWQRAVETALPQNKMEQYLPQPPQGKTLVVGGGKSAALMAQTLEKTWGNELSGLVVTRYGHTVHTDKIKVVEAGHPLPDRQGVEAAATMYNLLSNLQPEDLVICLISGGGSSLLTLPPPSLTLEDLIIIHHQLLCCGANISEINKVRKQLSLTAGGRLAATAYPATVVSLIISDVPGDDLQMIASGPTVGDEVTTTDTFSILKKYEITLGDRVREYLETNPYPVISPQDPRLAKTENYLIATPQESLSAAASLAQSYGYNTLILSDCIQGEAKEVAKVHAAIAKQVVRHQQPIVPPCIIFSGGETTVTVTGEGKGGPNTEFLLALAIALEATPGVYAIAGDTDGIDGSENNAGAFITPDILTKAHDLHLNPSAYLHHHDSYNFFLTVNSLLVTGPTLTNVNDFRAILIQ